MIRSFDRAIASAIMEDCRPCRGTGLDARERDQYGSPTNLLPDSRCSFCAGTGKRHRSIVSIHPCSKHGNAFDRSYLRLDVPCPECFLDENHYLQADYAIRVSAFDSGLACPPKDGAELRVKISGLPSAASKLMSGEELIAEIEREKELGLAVFPSVWYELGSRNQTLWGIVPGWLCVEFDGRAWPHE